MLKESIFIMTEKYDYIFKWTKNSTKQEHHIPDIEDFAKNNHNLFMTYHKLSIPIIQYDENTPEYNDAKKKMINLFEENETAFKPFLNIIKEKFDGKYV